PQPRTQGKPKIHASRPAAPGQDVAVPYDATIVDDGAEDRKKVPPRPMDGRAAAVEESGSPQDERSGADRSQIARGPSKPGNLLEKEVIFDGSEAAASAGHQQHVAGLDAGQVLQVREGEAGRRDRPATQRSHPNIQVRRAREKLMWTGEVELG